MKIAVTSQNFRTITGHAGKTRRFLVYEGESGADFKEIGRLDLPKEMAMHNFHGEDHPLYEMDVLITGGCGAGFIQRLASRGVRVVATSETDPATAVEAVLDGVELPPPESHAH